MTYSINHEKRILSLSTAKKLFLFLMIVFIFDFFLFPAAALASNEFEANISIDSSDIIQAPEELGPVFINKLPENNDVKIVKTAKYMVSAYNSEVGQCDSTPCITANGFNVCQHGIEDTIAANFLKFGTRVRMPEVFGDKVFIVRDRMNVRYHNRIDIWMQEKQDAKIFGVKYVKIEILAP